MEALLEVGANVNTTTENGYTALMYAAKYGSNETVKNLLERGAEVNRRTHDGRTALLYAAGEGRYDSMQILIARGAELDVDSEGACTALMKAAGGDYAKVVEFLLDKGVDAEVYSIGVSGFGSAQVSRDSLRITSLHTLPISSSISSSRTTLRTARRGWEGIHGIRSTI